MTIHTMIPSISLCWYVMCVISVVVVVAGQANEIAERGQAPAETAQGTFVFHVDISGQEIVSRHLALVL